MDAIPKSIEETGILLTEHGYLAGTALTTSLYLSLTLQRPLLLEGEPGVGKTELAKTLAAGLQRPLIRLQCYEGLDISAAVYEWNYARQLLHMRAVEASGASQDVTTLEQHLYTGDYLLARPLLKALELAQAGNQPVLLIDELDRADEPFEAYLLEFLSDYQITIPEFTTIKADTPPAVILTSNRTREVHDAIRRRCFYHWIDFPTPEHERKILSLKVPEATAELTRQLVNFVQSLRQMDLYKTPGIAESINWAQALTSLRCTSLDTALIRQTIGTLLKYQDDIERIDNSELERLISQAMQGGG